MPVPTPPTKTKNLSIADAQKLYFGRFRLTYTVSAKFTDDHIIAAASISKSQSIEAAVKRYPKNPNVDKSTWLAVNAQTLKDKAAAAPKVPCIYQGAQQMAIAIKVERRTVFITAKTRKEIQGDNPANYTPVRLGTEDRYLQFKSDRDDVTLCVRGRWNPLTGHVDIYHYQEGTLPSAEILPKYLTWVVDAAGTILYPAAKT